MMRGAYRRINAGAVIPAPAVARLSISSLVDLPGAVMAPAGPMKVTPTLPGLSAPGGSGV
jgi:hypothetical protein